MDEEMCEEAYRAISKAVARIPIDVVCVAAAAVMFDALDGMLVHDTELGDTDAVELGHQLHAELLELMADYGYQVNIGSLQ